MYVVIECHLDIRLRLLGRQMLELVKRQGEEVLGLDLWPNYVAGPKRIKIGFC